MTEKTTTAVSLRADADYTLALKMLAAQQNRLVCDLVREALDTAYGGQIETMRLFFANNGDKNSQTAKISKGRPRKQRNAQAVLP